MPPGRRYSKTEFVARGDKLYEEVLAPRMTSTDQGKFAAIDIETGEYEVDSDEMQACDRLYARIPTAQIWMVRIGSRYVHRFGGAGKRRVVHLHSENLLVSK